MRFCWLWISGKTTPAIFLLGAINIAERQQREGVSDKKGTPAHASSSDMSCRVINRVPLRKVR
jgi:hypothetical protein